MIKINLLTTKPSKKIPLGLVFAVGLCLLVAGAMFPAWIAAKEYVDNYNSELKEELQEKQRIRDNNSSKQKERDRHKKEIGRVKNEIARLQRLSGSNYIQWSDTLKTLKDIYPKDKVWITSLRIDSDRRVQITAYSANDNKGVNKPNLNQDGRLTVGIQKFIKQLLGNQYFSEVFLTNATKNIYEKKPVWRFELNCRLRREY